MAQRIPENLPAGDRELGRQLATLTLAGIRPSPVGASLRAVTWWNSLARLGIQAPLVVIHDLGLLLAQDGERVRLAREPLAPDGPATGYRRLLQEVASTESLSEIGSALVRDDVIAVLLARLIGDAYREWTAGAAAWRGIVVLPLLSPLYGLGISDLAQRWQSTWTEPFLDHLVRGRVGLLTRVEHLDLGILRVLSPETLPLGLPELYQLAALPSATRTVELCLDLLPSVLETRRRGVPQRLSVDGYASIERRGSADSLLPSELAHDPETFALRALSEELLYYTHERPHDEHRLVHGILVDASASMRGAREIFARGFALALSKKLALQGVSVWLRFFDSRLHRRVEGSSLAGEGLPYVVGFRSERGRNYERVFQDLLAELQTDPERDQQELSLTMITHAHCQVSKITMAALARRATLNAVFVLPTSDVLVDYLSVLNRHHVMMAKDWSSPRDRKRRALGILSSLAGEEAGR